MPRMSITLREPVLNRVLTLQQKERRAATAEMVSVLVEEALDARDRKVGRK